MVWFSGRLLLTAVMLCDILHGSPKYNRKVLVGIDGFRSGDTCVAFVATVESGEFFHGLQTLEIAGGREFRKKSKKIETFPEKLTVEIEAAVDTCTTRRDQNKEGDETRRPTIRFDSQLMESLRFEIFRKYKFDMTPLKKKLKAVGRTNSPTWHSSDTERWKYELELTSKDVPLNDSLVIDVLVPEGTRLARFSLRL